MSITSITLSSFPQLLWWFCLIFIILFQASCEICLRTGRSIRKMSAANADMKAAPNTLLTLMADTLLYDTVQPGRQKCCVHYLHTTCPATLIDDLQHFVVVDTYDLLPIHCFTKVLVKVLTKRSNWTKLGFVPTIYFYFLNLLNLSGNGSQVVS